MTSPSPPLQALYRRLAAEVGARVWSEPGYGYAGYVDFANGRRAFFKAGALDVNPHGAGELVRDKSYAAALLRHFGFAVPDDVLLSSPRYRAEVRLKNARVEASLGGLERALAFADAHGYPLYLKPNEGYGGHGVSRVGDDAELAADLTALFTQHLRVLLQTPARGRDYRLVVAGGEVRLAYERRPFAVTGDGEATMAELIEARIAELAAAGSGAKVAPDDPRIARALGAEGLGLDDVPAAGRELRLLPVANMTAGGAAIDVSETASAWFKALGVKACCQMGLQFAAVDLITDDIAADAADYRIIELNAAPGLNNYAALGPAAAGRVERLYRRLFELMAADPG